MKRYLPMFLVCLIPALISLGHDIYLYTLEPEEDIRFASIGWIWAHYHLPSFNAFINQTDKAVLEALDPYFGIQLTLFMAALTLILPLLIAIEYFLLRLGFGKIGPKYAERRRWKKLPK